MWLRNCFLEQAEVLISEAGLHINRQTAACLRVFTAVLVWGKYRHAWLAAALISHCSHFALQQLLKMREELKQREAELEKSLEDKQQLKNQVQTLKEGLHNLQSSRLTQVSVTEHVMGFPRAKSSDERTTSRISFTL